MTSHSHTSCKSSLSTYYAEQPVNSTQFRPARGVVNTVLMFHIKLTFLLYFCSFALTDVKKQIKKKNLETKFCLELFSHFFLPSPDGSSNQTAKNCLSPSNDDWHARHFFRKWNFCQLDERENELICNLDLLRRAGAVSRWFIAERRSSGHIQILLRNGDIRASPRNLISRVLTSEFM